MAAVDSAFGRDFQLPPVNLLRFHFRKAPGPFPLRKAMAKRFAARAGFVSGAIAITGSCALAQEALFRSVDSDRFAAQSRDSLEKTPYTFRLRELRVLVVPTMGLEWNDNVRLTESARESDLILSPRLDLNALHPLGEGNSLGVNVGIGYSKYLENDDLDQLLVTPGSALSLNMAVGDVQINVHDRLTYQLDPTAVGAVSGTGRFGGIDNSAGASISWNLHRITTSLGYDFLKWIATDSEFSYLDRSSHQVLARIGVQAYPNLMVGTEATASPSTYDDSYLNDNTSYSVGGYLDWQLTDQMHLAPRGGYSLTTFSASPVLGTPDDYGAFYFGLKLDHRPNETVAYNLSVDRQIRPGVDANLTDTLNTTLSATWSFIRHFPFNTAVYYEHGKQGGGGLSEIWDRFGGSVGVSYEFTRSLNTSVAYTFTFRDSKLADRDYTQNRVTLTLAYRL